MVEVENSKQAPKVLKAKPQRKPKVLGTYKRSLNLKGVMGSWGFHRP